MQFSRLLPILITITHCVTPDKSDPQDFKLDSQSDKKTQKNWPIVASESKEFLATTNHTGKTITSEWFVCQKGEARGAIFVLLEQTSALTKESFCLSWAAQAVLASNRIAIGMNMNGYGKSNGLADFGGSASQAAVKAVLEDAKRTLNLSSLHIWGYGEGAMLAALVAKKRYDLGWLILGGGIYDLEETLAETKNSSLRNKIETIRKSEGNAGIELRSPAFDLSDWPNNVYLYHSREDEFASLAQSEAVRDNLASLGRTATLQVIDGATHFIPENDHRMIIESMLSQR